jgi:hypothetical protein
MSLIQRRKTGFGLDAKLRDIPREWLVSCEPYVVRNKARFGDCWIWTGLVDREGFPILRFKDVHTGRYTTKRVSRFVASLFWQFEDYHYVRNICNNISCINPSHILPTNKHYKRR